ncbi:MAG: hypothetical protein IJ003_01525 [Candidatus Gastranaerophilales bacterium]|nr:hypothetical protein [Candidatus Gastranaerophilales bacterium]
MVDNRGISPVSSYFKPGDANSSANKMSEEKQGQGGEYFAQEMQEEESSEFNRETFQDRSAQLRASLNGLAMANAGSIMVMKTLKEREKEKNKKLKEENLENKEENQEALSEE